jgi:hypothetical protein
MAKWADYIITAVGYDRNETHIVEVEIRPDTGSDIGQASHATRQQIVDAIKRGVTFVTAYVHDRRWHRGEDVHVVVIGGVKYIRTDRNYVRADNLGALPRLARAAS